MAVLDVTHMEDKSSIFNSKTKQINNKYNNYASYIAWYIEKK